MSFEVNYTEYPILDQITYLDTPFEGLVPRSTWALLNQHADQQVKDFLQRDAQWRYALRGQVNKELACTLNLSPEEVTLTPGFSVGLRQFIPWLTRFKQVILIEDDYPTMLDAFSVGGFEITFISRDEDGSFSMEELAFAMEKNQGGLFAFCHVHNITGLKLQTDKIAGLARANGVTTLMDVTQSFASMPLNLASSQIDASVCSPYKWCGSGFGIGFVTVSKACEALSGAVDQLNTGHLDPYALLRFQHALRRMEERGLENTWKHIDKLNESLCQGLEQKGIKVYSDRSASSKSAILQFEGDEALQQKLMEQGVRTSFRGGGIRVGPHWYNQEADVNKLLNLLHG